MPMTGSGIPVTDMPLPGGPAGRGQGGPRALPSGSGSTPAEAPGAVKWRDWLKADYAVRLAAWSDIQEQMPLLYEAACRHPQPVIAELGTRTGNSTAALLAGASVTGGYVWSVDSGPVTVPDWWRVTGLWSFLAADDLSEQAAQWLPAELDVLFIDTSHLYEHTLAELRRYVPRIRSGGMVLCHDTELCRDDATMRVRIDDFRTDDSWLAVAAGGPKFPVAAALDTYCAEAGLAWTRQTERPCPAAPGKPFYGLGTILIP